HSRRHPASGPPHRYTAKHTSSWCAIRKQTPRGATHVYRYRPYILLYPTLTDPYATKPAYYSRPVRGSTSLEGIPHTLSVFFQEHRRAPIDVPAVPSDTLRRYASA